MEIRKDRRLMRFVKLVRDRAGDDSDSAIYAECKDREEFLRGLRAKLDEEVFEYLEDRNVEELADIYEAVVSLAKYGHGYSEADLLRIAHEKEKEKGGFRARIGLFLKREGEDG